MASGPYCISSASTKPVIPFRNDSAAKTSCLNCILCRFRASISWLRFSLTTLPANRRCNCVCARTNIQFQLKAQSNDPFRRSNDTRHSTREISWNELIAFPFHTMQPVTAIAVVLLGGDTAGARTGFVRLAPARVCEPEKWFAHD